MGSEPTGPGAAAGAVTAIAHRGEPLGHRENTLPSLLAAVAAGADMVEIDLRRTRDGQIVLLHDRTLERMWGLDAAIGDVDWDEVRRLGEGECRIPTLEATLEAVERPLMVDFTGPEVVDGALAAVTAAGALERCLFVTGHVGALRQLRAACPPARIGLTWNHAEPPAEDLVEELEAEFVNPDARLLTPLLVRWCREQGRSVSTWTVDDDSEMRRCLELGVDAIVSNRIAALLTVLGREPTGDRP